MTLAIMGYFDLHPDDVDAASAAARTVAAITATEPGCRLYAFSCDVSTPGRIRISELWDDEESLRTHLGQPHVADFVAMLGKLRITATDAVKYTISASGPVV